LTRLTPFDIIVAEMEEEVGESLHELVKTLGREVPRIEEYTVTSTFILAVGALLQDKEPSQRGFFRLDFSRFIQDWEKIVKGTHLLVQFLEEEKVLDGDRLPTESVLAPIAALWAQAPTSLDEGGNVRTLLRKYLWRAFFTDRYDRSVPTAVLQDYRALRKIIVEREQNVEVPIFDEQIYPLPTIEQLKEARWPKYRDRLGRAILLLSIRGGARDLADGSSISFQNIKGREYHHVYPKGWIRRKYGEENKANRALNCILITPTTNRVISDRDPLTYLMDRCEASLLGEEEIRRRLLTHFIDYETLKKNDYEYFLEKRAAAVEEAIRKLCKGEDWSPIV